MKHNIINKWKLCSKINPDSDDIYKVKGINDKTAYYNTNAKVWISSKDPFISCRVYPTHWKRLK